MTDLGINVLYDFGDSEPGVPWPPEPPNLLFEEKRDFAFRFVLSDYLSAGRPTPIEPNSLLPKTPAHLDRRDVLLRPPKVLGSRSLCK